MNKPRRAETILGLPVKEGVWTAIVTVTPEQARELIENQPPQFSISDRHVAALAALIRSGDFKTTHQGMGFDQAGLMLDGQHRCWACFETGINITVLCTFNLDRAEIFDAISADGATRTRKMPGLLVAKGLAASASDANSRVAAARFVWGYDRKLNPFSVHGTAGWSMAEFEQTLLAHPLLPEQLDALRNRRIGLPLAPAAGLFCLMHEADAARCAVFRHQILTGEGLTAGAPALVLRESIARDITRRSKENMDAGYRLVRAWNAFRDGKSVTRLYGSRSPRAERYRANQVDTFPSIAGYTRPGPFARAGAP